MNIGEIWSSLRIDGSKAKADATKAGGDAGTVGGKSFSDKFKAQLTTSNIGKGLLQGLGFAGGLGVAGVVAKSIGLVTDAIGDATTAFREDQVSQAALRASLEANIESWDGNTDAIERVLASRMKLGFSDDEQRASLAELVAATQDVDAALKIQGTAMDLARLKGMTLADASTLLGKVYQGNTGVLARYGIRLAKGTSGTQALAEVQKRAAGQAKAYGATAAGAAAILDTKVGELQESMGRLTSGAGELFVDFLSTIVDIISATPGGADQAVRDLAESIRGLRKDATEPAPAGTDWIKSIRDGLDAVQDAVQPAQDEFDDFQQSIADLSAKADVSRDALEQLWYALKGSGKTTEEARAAVIKYLESLVYLQTHADSSGKMLLSMLGPGGTVPKGLAGGADEIESTYRELGDNIADDIRASQDRVKAAAEDLAWAIKHPMAEARNRTRALMLLMGDDMVRAQNSKREFVRQAAEDTRKAIAGEFGGKRWWRLGARAAKQIGAGLRANFLVRIGPNGELYWNNPNPKPGEDSGGVIVEPKARGGPVAAGRMYRVNENRMEFFRPYASGEVLPLAPSAAGGMLSRQDVYHHISADGARNLRAAGYDEAGVAAVLMAAQRTAGTRYTNPRTSGG